MSVDDFCILWYSGVIHKLNLRSPALRPGTQVKNMDKEKIPVVVGVTGHRNIDGGDADMLRREVAAALGEIRAACAGKDGRDTPVVMLNAFAQGADMLCAEVAFGMGIEVYAVLPCEEERYAESFTDEAERAKLRGYLKRASRVTVAPDTEENAARLTGEYGMSVADYEYRQAGIYIAEHSHILLALWDGAPARGRFGCGTVEVIKFALEHKFSDSGHLFDPGIINDCAVLWLNVRRAGGERQPVNRRWLSGALAAEGGERYGNYSVSSKMPAYMADILARTVAYNAEKNFGADSGALWNDPAGLDEYRRNVAFHYAKADALSYAGNQRYYNLFILLIAVIGTFVAFTFMLYDDASLTFMILPCALAVVALVCLIRRGNAMGYHAKYVEYRAFAEACRIQFYMSMCLGERQILTNVCRLYSWTQKIDSAWIYKALQAVAATSAAEACRVGAGEIMDAWIGNGRRPKGQLRYHMEKSGKNSTVARRYERLTKCLNIATVAIYAAIFIMEAVGCILGALGKNWFWDGELICGVSWRSAGTIVMGTVTAASLLFNSYFGKLSFGRKAEDNRRMCMFYASACARWEEAKSLPADEMAKFIREIAREEIVENGIWCSYVKDNAPEINI